MSDVIHPEEQTVCAYCHGTGVVRLVEPAPPGYHVRVTVTTCRCQLGLGTPREAT